MNNRIVRLRKNKGWTQDEFAEKIGISKNYVSLIENGKKIPGDRLISDICKVFNVNEKWIRTGDGEMYNEPEDEVAEAVSDLLEDNNPLNSLIINILNAYRKMDDKSQKALNNLIQELFDNMKKRD